MSSTNLAIAALVAALSFGTTGSLPRRAAVWAVVLEVAFLAVMAGGCAGAGLPGPQVTEPAGAT